MAEEQGNQGQAAQPVAQQQTAPQVVKQSINDIIGSFLPAAERQKIAETEQKINQTPSPSAPTQGQPAAQVAETPKEEPKALEAKVAPEPAAAPKEEPKAVDKPAEPEVKSKFGLNTKKNEVSIETPEQLLETIRKDFGREDIKDLKDTSKFFEQTKDWRKKAQEFEKVAEQNKAYEDFLVTLPEPLMESMRAFSNGEDYKKPFANVPNFDFDKAVDKQDNIELVKHYFPKQYAKLSQEEIDDAKDGLFSDKFEPLLDASKGQFKTQQQARDSQRATQMEKAKLTQKAYSQSIDGSVQGLRQSFPDVENDVVAEITRTLSGGMKEIQKLFLNNDGTLKKEAAKNIMLAIHGEEEMKRLSVIAAHGAETKANEDILTRGSDTPKPKKTGNGGDAAPKVSKETAKQIADLGTGYGQKKVF